MGEPGGCERPHAYLLKVDPFQPINNGDTLLGRERFAVGAVLEGILALARTVGVGRTLH